MSGISSLSANTLYYANGSTQQSLQAVSTSAAGTTSASQQMIVNTGKRKQEIADYNNAIQALTKCLKDFNSSIAFSGNSIFDRMYEDKNGAPFRDLAYNDTKKIVKAYNQLNSVIKSSQFVTSDGQKLLASVQDLFTGGNATKFAAMGLNMDGASGELKLNTTKFKEFVSTDPDSVYSQIKNKDKLVDAMRSIISESTARGAAYFFYTPFEATV